MEGRTPVPERETLARLASHGATMVIFLSIGLVDKVQEALLQVESLMPQAVLEELKVTRKADLLLNQREFLVMEMTHTCWKAEEEKK